MPYFSDARVPCTGSFDNDWKLSTLGAESSGLEHGMERNQLMVGTPAQEAATTTRIRDSIAAALADIDQSDVAAGDRAVVLREVLRLRLGGSALAPEATVHTLETPPPPAALPIDESDVLGRISAKLRVERDLLELLYDVQDGKPSVVVSGKKLPDNKSYATKLLAQLVVGARQAAGMEEWTPVGEVRNVVNDYGRLDSGNFAASIQQLDNICLFRGKGANRELKVTKPGMEEIASVIKTLAGGQV